MVDPYAIVRRLTGHELISPKDARLLTEAVDGLIGEIGSKDARIAELEAENERLKQDRDEWKRWAEQHHSDLRRTESLSRTGAVKVKALEWDKGVVDCARPLPGMRYVACSTTPAGSWAWWLDEAPETRAVFPSEAEAKAAAQSDYERRILSALANHQRATSTVASHETANVSDKPEGQQPVVSAVRVCPVRDAICPHGMGCLYNDGMDCDMEASRADLAYQKHAASFTRPSEQAVTEAAMSQAEEMFADYFRRNYPGPDTIIGKPDWHSPKIFRAALHALRSVDALKAAMEADR